MGNARWTLVVEKEVCNMPQVDKTHINGLLLHECRLLFIPSSVPISGINISLTEFSLLYASTPTQSPSS